jgi:tRNA pseudouridine55 synthase
VSRARRAYGLRRIGHGGTLDPAVTGVLPLAIGSATRLLPYLSGEKSYRGTIQLGLRTSTDDLEGEVLEQLPLPALDAVALHDLLARFQGPIQQRPPQVSALHVDGERAYSRVRRGEQLLLPPRPVTIHQLVLLRCDAQRGLLTVAVRCSAGTYIRSLARDIGDLLGCGGCLAELRRTAAHGFSLEQAVPLEALDADTPPPLLDPLPALAALPRQTLEEHQIEGWRCGRKLEPWPHAAAGLCLDAPVVILLPSGNLAGIARCAADGWLQPRLVLEASG